jgi:hypothetical protein
MFERMYLKIVNNVGMRPVLGQKFFKNIGFKGCQISRLPGAPLCLGPALF